MIISFLPRIRVSFDYFLAVFSPSIPIIKNINIACCLNHNPRFSYSSSSSDRWYPFVFRRPPVNQISKYYSKYTYKYTFFVIKRRNLPSFGIRLVFIELVPTWPTPLTATPIKVIRNWRILRRGYGIELPRSVRTIRLIRVIK